MSTPMSHMHVQPTPTLTHIFYPDVPMQSHTHTGKCHESSSCVTCMRICRSTEAHHLPATLADRTKEETATRKVEIMTITFISKNAITQPAHSPAPLCSKQIYLLERCLYCDLTFPCFISLTLIPHYWKHITMAAGSTGASHGWEVEGTNMQTRNLRNCSWSPPASSTHSTPWSWLY